MAKMLRTYYMDAPLSKYVVKSIVVDIICYLNMSSSPLLSVYVI